MTELLAEQIAQKAMEEINVNKWSGFGDIPVGMETKTYKDTTEIKLNDKKYHYEITLDLNQEVTEDNNKDKPCLIVTLVDNDTHELLNRCKTYTLASSHIVAVMMLSLYREYGKVTKK